jgi:predicted HTH transcriptional regulator
MTPSQLSALLVELLSLPAETEWVEWKHNNDNPDMIAERISALANSAALHGRDFGYMVWGVEDGTKKVVGTTFRPRQSKKGNEELENWLIRSQHPQANFQMHEWSHQGVPMVLFQIPRASQAPVRFGSEEYIRIGSLTKKLKEYTEKERELWAIFSRKPFETCIAKADINGPDVLTLLDFDRCFKLLQISLPTDQQGILNKLADEALIVPKPGGRFDITNLGAILFATDLGRFERLGRKALRIIKYRGDGRTDTEREWRDAPSQTGYAVSFEAAVAFINSQLPQNEPIGQAFREEVRVYPEKAIRELVANCLIHQEFSVTGAGPMVEIFDSRMEITNPGEPLVDTLRFIDTPPKSRNETLAAMMRRMKICEEAGTGIDKVVAAIETFQLPAPDFTAITTSQPGFTKATLYAPRKLNDMDSKERIRACYQHACLCLVSGSRMTNASMRQRFGIEEHNAAKASRIIAEALAANLIKPFDPDQGKKYASYLPFWV